MAVSISIKEAITAALAFATAFAITFFLTPVIRSLAVRYGWIAKPVEDRWGRRVIARLGGVGMYLGFTLAAACWVPLKGPVVGLLLGALLVFGLGLADDIRHLPPYTKLVGQLLVGCTVVIGGIHIDLPQWMWLAIPLSVLWLVLIMNAFNLLDNMDGLAAGVGAIAAFFCAVDAVLSGNAMLVSLNAVLAGSCLAFLRFNFPPAKIYMGDSGSHFLGLSLAALSLIGTWHHSTQLLSVLVLPSLVLAVPIFDTLFVTIQRLAHGQHPFVGGTDHLSHRLAILGLSTRQTVTILYGLSFCVGLLSVTSLEFKPLTTLVIWLSALTMLLLIGRYLAQVNVYRINSSAALPVTEEADRSVTFIDTMLLHKRRLLEVLVDFAIVSGSYVFAHLLRFEGAMSEGLQRLIIQSLPVILVVKLASFASCGLYRGIWRYLGIPDILTVFKAVSLGSVFSLIALLYLWRFQGYSRAVLVIDWMITFLAVGGSRVVGRLLDEWIRHLTAEGVPVIIIGAGDMGARVVRLLKEEKRAAGRIVAFLDDDPRKQGNRIYGIPVLGARGQLAGVIREYAVAEVLVAIHDPPADLLEHVRTCCEASGICWKVVTAAVTHAA